jgi:predicted kinase
MKENLKELDRYDIVLVIGNYGSGKSELARTHFADRKRVDRHEIRHHMTEMTEHGRKWTSEDWDEDLEGLIKHFEHDLIVHFLERNVKLLIDNTSLTVKSRQRYIQAAQRYHKTIACVYLKRDVKTLIENNRKRDFPVPESVIVTRFARTQEPTREEGFGKIVVL